VNVGGKVGADGGFGDREAGGPLGDGGVDVLEAVIAGFTVGAALLRWEI